MNHRSKLHLSLMFPQHQTFLYKKSVSFDKLTLSCFYYNYYFLILITFLLIKKTINNANHAIAEIMALKIKNGVR